MPAFSVLLLDRDGTLIQDKHYLADPAGVELLPGVGEALRLLAARGIRFFLVSNQSGVGRGLFTLAAAYACNARLAELLAPYGVFFEEMLICPHTPEDACACRKPAPGMWLQLQQKYKLAAEQSLMVGDKEEDMLFAANAEIAGRALVLSGKGRLTAQKLGLSPYGEGAVQAFAEPQSSAHPHIVLTDCSLLPQGLDLLAEQWTRPCSG